MSCSSCRHGTKTFTFHNADKTFKQAQDDCETKEGILAEDLDDSTYAAFRQCCSGQEFYWIGLKRVRASKCGTGYQWIGHQECSDRDPLILNKQPVNGNECGAVTIQILSGDNNNNPKIPKARVENCDNAERKYICQKEKVIATTKPTSKTTTNSYKTTHSSLITLRKTTTVSSLADHKATDSLQIKINGSDSTSSVGGIAGALISCFLLLILAAFFLYRRKKGSNLSKKLNCFQSMKRSKKATDETKIKENHFTWVFKAIVDEIWFKTKMQLVIIMIWPYFPKASPVIIYLIYTI